MYLEYVSFIIKCMGKCIVNPNHFQRFGESPNRRIAESRTIFGIPYFKVQCGFDSNSKGVHYYIYSIPIPES